MTVVHIPKPSPDLSPSTRLTKALKYLELARVSRELPFDSIPYVVAAEFLIKKAMGTEANH